jgi:hypothetical protein
MARAKHLSSVLDTWAKLVNTLPRKLDAEVPLDPLRRMVGAAERDAKVASQRLGDRLEPKKRRLARHQMTFLLPPQAFEATAVVTQLVKCAAVENLGSLKGLPVALTVNRRF